MYLNLPIEKILNILNQIWWPVSLNRYVPKITWITYEGVKQIEKERIQIEEKEMPEVNYCLVFTTLEAIKISVHEMWVEEFWTCTGLDFHVDGMWIIHALEKYLSEYKCNNQ